MLDLNKIKSIPFTKEELHLVTTVVLGDLIRTEQKDILNQIGNERLQGFVSTMKEAEERVKNVSVDEQNNLVASVLSRLIDSYLQS